MEELRKCYAAKSFEGKAVEHADFIATLAGAVLTGGFGCFSYDAAVQIASAAVTVTALGCIDNSVSYLDPSMR